MPRRALAAVVLVVLAVSFAAAQRGGRRGFRFSQRPLAYATLDDFDGTFQFCRVVFRQAANGDGGNWSVDYRRAVRADALTTGATLPGAIVHARDREFIEDIGPAKSLLMPSGDSAPLRNRY
jgi:hypothetical protein